MLNTRKCMDLDCDNRIEMQPWPGSPPTKQRYCDPCRATRAKAAAARARTNRANGVKVRPRNGRGAHVKAAQTWVCQRLAQSRCRTCKASNILTLRFVPYKVTVPPQPSVFDLVARGADVDDLLDAAAGCSVICENCYAIEVAMVGSGFRRRFQLDLERASDRGNQPQLPRRAVLPPPPQPGEFGGAAVAQREIPRPRPSNLPPRHVRAQAAPQEPAGGASQEHVGDVTAAMATRQPVGETAAGGRPDHAVGAGEHGRLNTRLINPGIIVGGRFVRPQRQR